MVKSFNLNLIAAVNSFKVDKHETSQYIKYIVVKDGFYYITNSVILFQIPCNDDAVVDGFYQVSTKTNKEISLVKIAEHENCLPNYDGILNDVEGYNLMDDIVDDCGINMLAFLIATKYNACFDFKYLQIICDMGVYTQLLFKSNVTPIEVINDDFKFCIMPIRIE